MRIFPEDVERRIHELELARTWRRSKLIEAEQLAGIEKDLAAGEPLPLTAGWAVRLLFFGFSCLAQLAVLAFFCWDVRPERRAGWIILGAAPAFYALGEYLLRRARLYRFGVEEGLFVGSLVQLAVGLFILLEPSLARGHGMVVVGLLTALASLYLYLRLGYVYAGLGVVVALSWVVFGFDLPRDGARAALAGLYAFLLLLSTLHAQVSDHDRDGWEFLQGGVLLALYLVLNLQLGSLNLGFFHAGRGSGAFYWATFVLIFVVPAAGLVWGVGTRKRPVIFAAGIAALLTIMTWKPYLGYARHVWDPAILGALLMGLATALDRWLKAGPGGTRSGITGKSLLQGREDKLGLGAALAAAAAAAGAGAGHSGSSRPDKPRFEGGGGSAGGGGASGGF